MNNTPCHCCDGSGLEADQKQIGKELSSFRHLCKIGCREMAGLLGISHSHLSCLEHGKRRWDKRMKSRYLAILDDAGLQQLH